MVLFVCEDCPDGILTGVYEAWASRLGHANVALRVAGLENLELFAEYRAVAVSGEKARKVAETIRRRMGELSWEMIYQALLACAPDRADCVYRVLAAGLSVHTDPWTARHLLEKVQDPHVCRVFELSRRVGSEARRYLEFVRFRELENGVLFSEIETENQILPLIGDHFSDRFPNERFLIYDHRTGDCLIHVPQRQWVLWRGAGEELFSILERGTESRGGAGTELPARPASGQGGLPGLPVSGDDSRGPGIRSLGEQQVQRLWRGFCDAVSIRERENLRLQRQFWPLKYRRWMTEGQPEAKDPPPLPGGTPQMIV